MKTNDLYSAARKGGPGDEKRMLEYLAVRFSVIAHLKIGNREDAEEVVQDALAAVARDYRNLEFASFRAWAYKVFDNRLLNYIGTRMRHASRQTVALDDRLDAGTNPVPDPDLKVRLSDCFGKVRKANSRYARTLNLHYQGFTTEEICRKLEVTKENLYMVLSRARVMLKRCLDTGDISS